MTADLFEDPGQELLARGTADPIETLQLSQAEQDQLDVVRDEANSARTLAQVGLVLGAAFLLYRHYVHRRTLAQVSSQPESRFLQALTLRNARNFIPAWVYMVTPALETAYTVGMVKGGNAAIPDEMVTQYAQRYATDIADYINDSSAQALAEGFNIYVNKKVARRVAAEKALQGFGLNSRMMRALVGRAARAQIDSVVELNHDATTRDWIEMMLVQRAHDIGDNEGFNVSQHGQQITWLYLQRTGRLSPLALKVWHTARDERVCPSCGPLDKQAVPVNQPFNTVFGKLWVPSMHPNCRCEVRLRSLVRDEFVAEQVAKADPFLEREHPRARDGRFRAKLKEQESDLERLLREVQERQTPEEPAVDLGAAVDLSTGVDLGPTSLGGTSLAGVDLGPVDLDAPEPVQLAQPAVSIPGLNLAEPAVELGPEAQQMVDLATAQDAVNLEEKVKAPVKAEPGVIDLPHTLYRLDPAGFHYYEGVSEHLELAEDTESQYAHFEPEHEFTNLTGIADQTSVMYTREIKREVERIMKSGRNYIRAEGQSLDNALVMDADYVELAITAEIVGTDEPQLRAWANAMGVSRHDWTMARYRMDRAWANGFEGDLHEHGETEFYSAPGTYFASEDMIPMTGWPVIDYELEPETYEGQYEDWYGERDDWPPS